MIVRIDPPRTLQGEGLCPHDMLIFNGRSTCAFCLRLPDVPDLDLYERVDPAADRGKHAWFITDKSGRCARCDKGYGLNAWVTWSAADGAVVGDCCAATL